MMVLFFQIKNVRFLKVELLRQGYQLQDSKGD